MKIVHICLSNFYVDNCGYQENQLVAQHVKEGHDVLVIASTEIIDKKGCLNYVSPSYYVGSDGAFVCRIPYSRWLLKRWAKKIRIYEGTNKLLTKFNPDVILFHGSCALEILVVAKYVKQHPRTVFYIDSHEDFNNSAKSFMSKWLLHWMIYRVILLNALPMVRKVLCITPETINFQREFYGLKDDQVELFPLGGDIYEDEAYYNVRKTERHARRISENICLYVQSGKFDKAKKLTNTLRAFSQIPGDHVRLLLAGKIMADVEKEVELLIAADPRVSFIGWINPSELKALLCAADVYVQPGSQSATMQMSLCCRCAVVLDDVTSHKIYHAGNGYLVENDAQLEQALLNMAKSSREELSAMSNSSRDVASRWLDYRKLAQRILY
jgi:1,2-diacylglycerol 3-alpha-glucosyltransferase